MDKQFADFYASVPVGERPSPRAERGVDRALRVKIQALESASKPHDPSDALAGICDALAALQARCTELEAKLEALDLAHDVTVDMLGDLSAPEPAQPTDEASP